MTQLGCKVHILFVAVIQLIYKIFLFSGLCNYSTNFTNMMTAVSTGFGWGADKDVCFNCLAFVKSFFNTHTHTHTVVVGIMTRIFQT